jgi:DNA transformation protein
MSVHPPRTARQEPRPPESLSNVSTPITELRNLGPRSSEWLQAAGITTIEQLREVGAAGAYSLVRSQQPKATLNLLWGLAAGLEDRDWRKLNEAEKESLRREVGDD